MTDLKGITTRERLLKVFRGEKVDRVPISPFIHNDFVKFFSGKTKPDIIKETIEVYDYFGFDLIHRNVNIRFEEKQLNCKNWQVTTEMSGGEKVITNIITPKGNLRQVIRKNEINKYLMADTVVEHYLKNENDFKLMKKFKPYPTKLKLEELKKARKVIGEKGILAPWMDGVFNYASKMVKLDKLILTAYSKPNFYGQLMEYFLNYLKKYIQQVIDIGVDVLSYAGNKAGGSFVGPDFFVKNVLPYEKELIDFIQNQGVHVLYHNCGDGASLYHLYNKLGMSAYESLAEPPYGDNNLKEALQKFNRDITLIGNLDQISFLPEAEPDKVRKVVREKINLAKKRGNFILGTSDFIGLKTPFENLQALNEAGKRYGIYE